MAVHEAIKARQLSTSCVIVAPVLAPIEALFLPHESVRVLGDFLSYSGMLLQILLQRGMLLDKFLVRNQRGISAQLLGHFGMAIHKAIKARKLSTSRVVVLREGLCTTLGRKLCTRGDQPEQGCESQQRQKGLDGQKYLFHKCYGLLDESLCYPALQYL